MPAATVESFAFTERRVREAADPPAGKRMRYRDTTVPGLVLRVSAGRRVFALRVKADGRPVEITIGPWPRMTVEGARAQARALATDPAAAAKRRRERRTEGTVREAWDAHLRDHKSTLRPTTLRSYQETWTATIDPAIGSKRVSDVTPADIKRMRDRAEEAHGASHARRAVAVASILFNALAADPATRLVNVPTRGVARPRVEPRRRYLNAAELGAFLRGLAAELPLWRAFWTTCLLAPLRRGNIAAARWSDLVLDGDSPQWLVPAAQAKGHRLIAMPIVVPLARMLRDWRASNADPVWVFPAGATAGPRKGATHIVSVQHAWRRALLNASAVRLCDAIAKAEVRDAASVLTDFRASVDAERIACVGTSAPLEGTPLERCLERLRQRVATLGIDPEPLMLRDATPHDLRRTSASWAVQGGASIAIVAASLGHADSRVAEAHYAHLSDSPVRGMLDANAVRLLATTSPAVGATA